MANDCAFVNRLRQNAAERIFPLFDDSGSNRYKADRIQNSEQARAQLFQSSLNYSIIRRVIDMDFPIRVKPSRSSCRLRTRVHRSPILYAISPILYYKRCLYQRRLNWYVSKIKFNKYCLLNLKLKKNVLSIIEKKGWLPVASWVFCH